MAKNGKMASKIKTFGPSHLKFPPCAGLYSSLQYRSHTIPYMPYTPWYQTSHNLQKNKVLVKTSFRNDEEWLVCFPVQFKYTHLKVVRWLLKYNKKMTKERHEYEIPQFIYNSLQLKVINCDNSERFQIYNSTLHYIQNKQWLAYYLY